MISNLVVAMPLLPLLQLKLVYLYSVMDSWTVDLDVVVVDTNTAGPKLVTTLNTRLPTLLMMLTLTQSQSM